MNRSVYIFVIVLGLGVGLTSCFKNVDFPDTPAISDAELTIMSDSAELSFSFTDGDGDIGLDDSEISPPYDTASKYHFNLYIEYYEKDDVLGWQQGIGLTGDTIVFKYRLERIEIKGKSKGIKGTMDVLMADFYNPFSSQNDTIKYRIQLINRFLRIQSSSSYTFSRE